MSKRDRVEDHPVLANLRKKTKPLEHHEGTDSSNKENIWRTDEIFETNAEMYHTDSPILAKLKGSRTMDSGNPSQIDLNVKNIAENFEQILKHQSDAKPSTTPKGKWLVREAPVLSERMESILKEHESASARMESSPANRSLENIRVNVKSLAQKFCFDKSKGDDDTLSVDAVHSFSRTPGRKVASLNQDGHTPLSLKFKSVESIATPSQIFKSKLYGKKGSRSDSRSGDKLKSINRSVCIERDGSESPQENPVKIHVDISNLREVFEKKSFTKTDVEESYADDGNKDKKGRIETTVPVLQRSGENFEKKSFTKKDLLEKAMDENVKELERSWNLEDEAKDGCVVQQANENFSKTNLEKAMEENVKELEKSWNLGADTKADTVLASEEECEKIDATKKPLEGKEAEEYVIDTKIKERVNEIGNEEESCEGGTETNVYVLERLDELFQSIPPNDIEEKDSSATVNEKQAGLKENGEIIHTSPMSSDKIGMGEKIIPTVPEIEVKACVDTIKNPQQLLLVPNDDGGHMEKAVNMDVTPVILITNDEGECIDRIEGQELNQGQPHNTHDDTEAMSFMEDEEDATECIGYVTLRKKLTNKKTKKPSDTTSLQEESNGEAKEDCISVSEGVLVFQTQKPGNAAEARVEKRHGIAPRLAEKLSRLSKNLENLGEFMGGAKPISMASCSEAPIDVQEVGNQLTEDVFMSPERKKSILHDRKAVSPRVLKRCMDSSDLCTDNTQVFDAAANYDTLRSCDDNCIATDKECKEEKQTLQIKQPSRGFSLNSASKLGSSIDGDLEYETVSPGKKPCLWNIKESTPVVNKRDIKFSVNLDNVTNASKLEASSFLPSYGDSAKLASDFSLPGEYSSCKGEISYLPGLSSLGSTADSIKLDKIAPALCKKRARSCSCDRNIKYFHQKPVISTPAKKKGLDQACENNQKILENKGDCSFEELYKEAKLTLNLKDEKKGQEDSGVSDLDQSFEDMVESNREVLWRYIVLVRCRYLHFPVSITVEPC